MLLNDRKEALVFALLILIVLPGGYFGLKYSNRIEHVETMVQAKVRSIKALAYVNPDS